MAVTASMDDLRLEEDQGGPSTRLTLDNVKGLTAVLQAIKPGAKQVADAPAGRAAGRGRRAGRMGAAVPHKTHGRLHCATPAHPQQKQRPS